MRPFATLLLLTACLGITTAAAESPTTIREEIRGLVEGAQAGQPVQITVLPREALPGSAQRIQTVLQADGTFLEPTDFVPGLNDITVQYGAFTKSSRVRVVIEPQELLIRLDWTGGGVGSLCRLYADERRVLDQPALRGARRQLGPRSEILYYGSATAGMYPMWVHYESGTGTCIATVTAILNGRVLFTRQQSFTRADGFNPLAGEGVPSSNTSAWHVGTFSLSSGSLVGAWRVVDAQGAPAWIGRRTMAPQGELLNADEGNAARIPAAVYPLSDYTLQDLVGAQGAGAVSLTLGQSTAVRAYGTVSDVRGPENKPQELLGLTSLEGSTLVGILDDRGIFTALAPGTVTVVAKDGKGTTKSISITVTGSATDTDGDGLPDATEVAIGTDPLQVDTDGDGLPDRYEVRHQLNPVVADAQEDRDGDGLTNAQEFAAGTAADRIDTDRDRISDSQEFVQGTDPLDGSDSDSDRLSDAAEVYYGTNPKLGDSDGDFVPDGIEVTRGTDPLRALSFPAIYDADNDGLTTLHEEWINSNLASLGYAGDFSMNTQSWDSDGDLLSDGYEVSYGLDPTKNNKIGGSYTDTDSDGVDDFDEQIYGTNPSLPDTDGDGTLDGEEIANGTDPNDPSDGAQVADSDGDGIPDDKEAYYGTDPNNPDSDNDGVNDGDEISQGYDPTDPSGYPGDGQGPTIPEEPPHYTRAELSLQVGDSSGSNSERWRLQVGPLGYVSPDFGVVGSRDFDTFKRGQIYPVSMAHVASNYDSPDYDWVATINGMGGSTGWSEGTVTVYNQDKSKESTGPIVIYDQDKDASYSLLQAYEYHGDDENLTSGKKAYAILPYARIHGTSDVEAPLPKYTVSLPKRRGTISEPVIQMESGGDGAVNGCSLYGVKETGKNKWKLKAIATAEDGTPRPADYTIQWSGFPGAGSQETVDVGPLEPGRYTPTLTVRNQYGDTVGVAAIHSLVVEEKATDNVAPKPGNVDARKQQGAEFTVTKFLTGGETTPKPFKMDLRVGGKPSNAIRSRVSLDGYPQNEYWVTAADSGDLPQVLNASDSATIFVQGYRDPSQAMSDITLQVEGGWAVSNSTETEKTTRWYPLDENKITAIAVEWVTPEAYSPNGVPQHGTIASVNYPVSSLVPSLLLDDPSVSIAGTEMTVTLAGTVIDPLAILGHVSSTQVTIRVNGGESFQVDLTQQNGGGSGIWGERAKLLKIPSTQVRVPVSETVEIQAEYTNDAGVTGSVRASRTITSTPGLVQQLPNPLRDKAITMSGVAALDSSVNQLQVAFDGGTSVAFIETAPTSNRFAQGARSLRLVSPPGVGPLLWEAEGFMSSTATVMTTAAGAMQSGVIDGGFDKAAWPQPSETPVAYAAGTASNASSDDDAIVRNAPISLRLRGPLSSSSARGFGATIAGTEVEFTIRDSFAFASQSGSPLIGYAYMTDGLVQFIGVAPSGGLVEFLLVGGGSAPAVAAKTAASTTSQDGAGNPKMASLSSGGESTGEDEDATPVVLTAEEKKLYEANAKSFAFDFIPDTDNDATEPLAADDGPVSISSFELRSLLAGEPRESLEFFAGSDLGKESTLDIRVKTKVNDFIMTIRSGETDEVVQLYHGHPGELLTATRKTEFKRFDGGYYPVKPGTDERLTFILYHDLDSEGVAEAEPETAVITDAEWLRLRDEHGLLVLHNSRFTALAYDIPFWNALKAQHGREAASLIYRGFVNFKGCENHHLFNIFRTKPGADPYLGKNFFKDVFGPQFDVNDYTVPVKAKKHKAFSNHVTAAWKGFISEHIDEVTGKLKPQFNNPAELLKLRQATLEKAYGLAETYKYADRLGHVRPYHSGQARGLARTKAKLPGSSLPGLIQLEENAGRPLAAKVMNADGTTELKKNPRLQVIITKSLNIYKRAASAIGISIFKKCTDSLITKGKFVARVGGKVVRVGAILMLVGTIAAGGDPVDEGLRSLVGIDAETARRVLDGELVPSLPNPIDWIVNQSVDICYFTDGSMLRVGQNIVCYGQRENGERYWYDTKIDKIITTDRVLGENGQPIATVIVQYRHDNRDDTNTWATKPITKVSDLPDRTQFMGE